MNIGKLTRVPLRDVWTHEATGFTRWLEDNVEILNEVIDLNVTAAERERVAGSFSVDFVAEDDDTAVMEDTTGNSTVRRSSLRVQEGAGRPS